MKDNQQQDKDQKHLNDRIEAQQGSIDALKEQNKMKDGIIKRLEDFIKSMGKKPPK